MARHRALDELRRSGRRREDPVGLAAGGGPVAGDDPAAQVVERAETRRALGLIAGLPRSQAEVVMLRVVLGLDVAQTAAVLGRRPGAVRVAAMRGLQRLADTLEAEGAGAGAQRGGHARVVWEATE